MHIVLLSSSSQYIRAVVLTCLRIRCLPMTAFPTCLHPGRRHALTLSLRIRPPTALTGTRPSTAALMDLCASIITPPDRAAARRSHPAIPVTSLQAHTSHARVRKRFALPPIHPHRTFSLTPEALYNRRSKTRQWCVYKLVTNSQSQLVDETWCGGHTCQ
jgi:hypothetical protein